MRKDSLIPSLLGIPPIQISRELEKLTLSSFSSFFIGQPMQKG